MILICGGLADPMIELICAQLTACDYPYRLLDLGVYPAGFRVNWQWRGAFPDGYLVGADWRLDLSEVRGVYVRFLGSEGRVPPPSLTPELAQAVYVECDTQLAALLEYLPGTVVNRLAGGFSNHSKLFQGLVVRRCGLRTPPTLVTSDPAAARRFYDECDGEVIYKSLSGVRSIVRRMEEEHLARLPLLRHAQTQFQAFIPGENVRVHTVGDRWFATRIQAEVVDYRYASREGRAVDLEATTLPPMVAAACLRLARDLGLLLAGIDLKKTPDGDYYCFEINPAPAFMYYELGSGQPISMALADLLYHGAPSGAWQQEDADGISPSITPAL